MKLRHYVVALAAITAASSRAFVYLYDDGVSDDFLTTSGPATFNVAYLTQFTAQAGANTISSIDVVWGSRLSPNLPNGLLADVFLMSDPNNDGDPVDGAILASVSTTTTNVGSDTFNNYAISPTFVATGQNFFVGAFIQNVPTGSSWVAMDSNAVGMTSRNWWNVVVSSPVGFYNNMSLFQFPDYSFMLRANTVVPEPATLLALGIGAAALLRRRRD